MLRRSPETTTHCGRWLRLSTIVKALNGQLLGVDVNVTNVGTDSRNTNKNQLFVAIKGDKIAFQVPDKSGNWKFEGKILKNGIKGTAVSVVGNPVSIVLPRKKSHWD